MRRKAFVTGGTGAVGRNFLPKLLDHGWHVTALTRDVDKKDLLRHDCLTYMAGDLGSEDTVRRLLSVKEQYDVVFHLAASLDYFASLEKLLSINARGTQLMAEFARAVGARRFVYASSVEAAGSFKLSEIPAPVEWIRPAATHYGTSKIAAEKYALALVDSGIPSICMRIGNVYGPGWYNFVVELASNLLNRGRLWEYLPAFGHRYISPIENEDVADGLLAGASNSYSGVVNLVGEGATIEEIVRACADVMHVPFSCGRLKPLDRLYVHCSHFARSSEPFMAYVLAPRWPRIHRAFAMQESAALLGWKPRWSLRDGIKKTIDWARSEGLLKPR